MEEQKSKRASENWKPMIINEDAVTGLLGQSEIFEADARK